MGRIIYIVWGKISELPRKSGKPLANSSLGRDVPSVRDDHSLILIPCFHSMFPFYISLKKHLISLKPFSRRDVVIPLCLVGQRGTDFPPDYSISIAIAVPSPPPIHRVAIPRFFPCLRSAPIKVTMIRAPEAPIGCPKAQAPP